MPVLRRGGHRGRAAAKPTPPIVEPGGAIATRTRRRQQQPQLKKSNWQQQNRHQIPVAINENAPPEGVALLTAAPVAPEEDKIFEEEAGRKVVREKKMDDCCNGARSIDKANAGDEDGSTPPIPEKADGETDEVYAQMTLQPVSKHEKGSHYWHQIWDSSKTGSHQSSSAKLLLLVTQALMVDFQCLVGQLRRSFRLVCPE